MTKPKSKFIIVGGGIIAVLEAYFAILRAQQSGELIRITFHEKNNDITETTACNIAPSLTPDELLSVVPPAPELIAKLEIPFHETGGIRVDDVADVFNQSAIEFLEAVKKYNENQQLHLLKTETLLALGKVSMDMWANIYQHADPELKQILEKSNFTPCRNLSSEQRKLKDGYRIDLLYEMPGAQAKAKVMKETYTKLGYSACEILSPEEVKILDPSLAYFCDMHSEDMDGIRVWKQDAVAIYRPGGCIDIATFLPLFYEYLKKIGGQYINGEGKIKDCVRLKLGHEVVGILNQPDDQQDNAEYAPPITGLKVFDHVKQMSREVRSKSAYEKEEYVFCPGEAVKVLRDLGCASPAYARFAGASLMLKIPLPEGEKLEELLRLYPNFNHCMEVHKEGVVLAWQARLADKFISLAVAGTKAFYGEQKPTNDDAFAKYRHVSHLNMLNDVLPDFISLALRRNTKGQKLTADDLGCLVEKGIAKKWVGTRAVAYDGFPACGGIFSRVTAKEIPNARVTAFAGSGGVSFGPALVAASSASLKVPYFELNSELAGKVLDYSRSCRQP